MTRFKDIIFEENVVIHCPEEWMAEKLLRYADIKGYKDGVENSYLQYSNAWYVHKEETTYILSRGTYSCLSLKRHNDKIFHYNDVVIKEENNNIVNFTVEIDGKQLKLGDRAWSKSRNTYGFIYGFTKDLNKDIQISLYINGTQIISELINNISLSKPIIYQLPDTDGNLSEVKIGRHVWLGYKDGNVYKCVISGVNGNNIEIMNICDNGKVYASNKEGLSFSGGRVTTNKPHRDFSDCMDWSHAPKDSVCWTITSNGYSLWWRTEPHTIEDICWESGYEYGIHAGYRADLLSENGIVEDWEHSLVKRPNNK